MVTSVRGETKLTHSRAPRATIIFPLTNILTIYF